VEDDSSSGEDNSDDEEAVTDTPVSEYQVPTTVRRKQLQCLSQSMSWEDQTCTQYKNECHSLIISPTHDSPNTVVSRKVVLRKCKSIRNIIKLGVMGHGGQ